MSRKDRLKTAQTGKVHRSGEEVDKPEPLGECDIPHCVNRQHPALAKANMPLCGPHGDLVLTMIHVWPKIPGMVAAATGQAPSRSGLVVARNISEEREALKDLGKQMSRRP